MNRCISSEFFKLALSYLNLKMEVSLSGGCLSLLPLGGSQSYQSYHRCLTSRACCVMLASRTLKYDDGRVCIISTDCIMSASPRSSAIRQTAPLFIREPGGMPLLSLLTRWNGAFLMRHHLTNECIISLTSVNPTSHNKHYSC